MEQNKNELINGTVTTTSPGQNETKFIDNTDRTVAEEILQELKPFKKTMVNALNRRGIYANGMSFANVCISFYNNFTSPIKAIPINFVADHPALNLKISEFDHLDMLDSGGEAVLAGGLTAAGSAVGVPVLGAIAPAITGLLTSIKNKAQLKKAKELVANGDLAGLTPHYKLLLATDNPAWETPLTSEEKLLVKDVNVATSGLQKAADSELSVTESALKKKIIIGVVVTVLLLAVYFIFFKK